MGAGNRIVSYFNRFRGFSRDAKLFLFATMFAATGFSVIWLVLNFYLEALDYSQTYIGWINALPSLVTALLGIPIGVFSDRLPRKFMLVLGSTLAAGGGAGIVLWTDPLALAAFTALSGVGFTAVVANAAPFMTEHSTVLKRTALFSAQAAISHGTGFLGSLLGGYFPEIFAVWFGVDPHDLAPLRLTLGVVAVLQLSAVLPMLLLSGKDGEAEKVNLEYTAPEPSLPPRRGLSQPGLFVKMLIPTILVGLGAGQTMPFLNLFIQGKFGISFSQLGWLFALASLVTAAGILAQPLLADRLGKVRSVVAVQLVSMPFLFLLGFSPYFFLTAVSMLVRGMLMNMANPVYMAFCMEQLPKRERATFAGSYEVVWSVGWATGSAFSGWYRDQVGFEAGFNTVFLIMAGCYILSTLLLYLFFGRDE